MYKKIDLGNGLRLTESDDMGIFIHYKSKSGHECGQFMGNTDEIMGHKWAAELLAEIPDNNKRVGMYGQTPRIKIGSFTICRQDPDREDDSVWLENDEGEGGQFKDSLIEKTIIEFFNKYL